MHDKCRLLTEADKTHGCPSFPDPWATEANVPWRSLRPGAQPPAWLEPGLRLLDLGVPEKGPALPVLQGRQEESRGRAGDEGPAWT